MLTLEEELHFCTGSYTKRKSMDDEVNVLLCGRIALSHSEVCVTSIYCAQYFTIIKEKSFFSCSD